MTSKSPSRFDVSLASTASPLTPGCGLHDQSCVRVPAAHSPRNAAASHFRHGSPQTQAALLTAPQSFSWNPSAACTILAVLLDCIARRSLPARTTGQLPCDRRLSCSMACGPMNRHAAVRIAVRGGILAGAASGLASPSKKISGIMPHTVIRPATWQTSTGSTAPLGAPWRLRSRR